MKNLLEGFGVVGGCILYILFNLTWIYIVVKIAKHIWFM